ncbi:hypothetical protein M3J07_009870 [Ascochyta lentis]
MALARQRSCHAAESIPRTPKLAEFCLIFDMADWDNRQQHDTPKKNKV